VCTRAECTVSSAARVDQPADVRGQLASVGRTRVAQEASRIWASIEMCWLQEIRRSLTFVRHPSLDSRRCACDDATRRTACLRTKDWVPIPILHRYPRAARPHAVRRRARARWSGCIFCCAWAIRVLVPPGSTTATRTWRSVTSSNTKGVAGQSLRGSFIKASCDDERLNYGYIFFGAERSWPANILQYNGFPEETDEHSLPRSRSGRTRGDQRDAPRHKAAPATTSPRSTVLRWPT